MRVIAPLVERQLGIRIFRFSVTVLAGFLFAHLREGAYPFIINLIGTAVRLEFDLNPGFFWVILQATSDVVSRCPSGKDDILSTCQGHSEEASAIGQSEGFCSLKPYQGPWDWSLSITHDATNDDLLTGTLLISAGKRLGGGLGRQNGD
jgi:hypothetical protein